MVHGILSYRGRKLGPGVLESTSEGCPDTVNNMSIHIFCMEGSGWLFGLDLGGEGGVVHGILSCRGRTLRPGVLESTSGGVLRHYK